MKIEYKTYGKSIPQKLNEVNEILKKQCEQTMKEFPKISHKCNTCGGDGLEDVSYHGSPQYEPCQRCDGKKDVIYYREMTVNEKLDYLLNLIIDMKLSR